ncbi:MAG: carboxypeptidase-like regulatory domain-containing protein [Bacteroidales bacterium]|nr:carboxypeptidase-like regulatory domain-containing protein [Bacteroidales bacterium]
MSFKLLPVFLILCPFYGSGAFYNGRVIDLATNLPVIGAEITLSGTDVKVYSDVNGMFDLPVQDNTSQLDVFVLGNILYWQSSDKLDIRFIMLSDK